MSLIQKELRLIDRKMASTVAERLDSQVSSQKKTQVSQKLEKPSPTVTMK